jgi:hypothetical protein
VRLQPATAREREKQLCSSRSQQKYIYTSSYVSWSNISFRCAYEPKNVLAILRPYAASDSAEECVISVIDPDLDEDAADDDPGGGECRLVLRLFCKHGQSLNI